MIIMVILITITPMTMIMMTQNNYENNKIGSDDYFDINHAQTMITMTISTGKRLETHTNCKPLHDRWSVVKIWICIKWIAVASGSTLETRWLKKYRILQS